jgi:hypothetical protein
MGSNTRLGSSPWEQVEPVVQARQVLLLMEALGQSVA